MTKFKDILRYLKIEENDTFMETLYQTTTICHRYADSKYSYLNNCRRKIILPVNLSNNLTRCLEILFRPQKI